MQLFQCLTPRPLDRQTLCPMDRERCNGYPFTLHYLLFCDGRHFLSPFWIRVDPLMGIIAQTANESVRSDAEAAEIVYRRRFFAGQNLATRITKVAILSDDRTQWIAIFFGANDRKNPASGELCLSNATVAFGRCNSVWIKKRGENVLIFSPIWRFPIRKMLNNKTFDSSRCEDFWLK